MNILTAHKKGYNPLAGEDWCLPCNQQWPCDTVAMYDRCLEYEAALRRIMEMDYLIDIKEFANRTLVAHGAAADLHGAGESDDTRSTTA